MGIGQIAIPLVSSLVDVGFNWLGNKQRESLGREGAGMLTGFADTFDSGYYRDLMGPGSAANSAYIANGQYYNPAGQAPGNAINLDEIFGVKGDLSDYFDTKYGEGFDYGKLQGQVSSVFDRGRQGVAELPSRINEFYGPDQEFEEFFASQVGAIGSGSAERESAATRNILGRGFASGRSLEEMSGDLASTQYGEQQARSAAAQQARAAQEGMASNVRMQRAGSQTQGLLTGANINASLAGQEAAAIQGLGLAEAGERMRAVEGSVAAENYDIANQQTQDQNKFGALRMFASDDQRIADLVANIRAQMTSQAGGLTAGIANTWNTVLPGAAFMQGYGQLYAADAMKPKESSSFNISGGIFPGFGFGNGCIDAYAVVESQRRGLIPLIAVDAGEMIRAGDGSFYPAVGKDCGANAETDLVEVTVDGRSIVATRDHVIVGLAAGAHEKTKAATARPLGDLMLEDNHSYLANGLDVESNIGRRGLTGWRESIRDTFTFDGYVHATNNPHGVFAKAV